MARSSPSAAEGGGRQGERRNGKEEALGDTKRTAPLGFPILETRLGHWTDEPRVYSEICQSHLNCVSISTMNKFFSEEKNSNYKEKSHIVEMYGSLLASTCYKTKVAMDDACK